MHFPGLPHPTRAFGAPPPPPSGAWAVLAISGEQPCPGWSRREIVSGVELVGNRIRGVAGGKPYPALSHLSPCTGPCGYRHGGWGRRGGGTRSPSPVSNAPEIPHIFSAPPLPRLRQGIPGYLAGTPTPPAPSQEYPYASLRFPPRRGYPYASAGPPLHHASGMRPVRPHGAVWWSIDRAEVSRACFGRQSLAEPPSRALQPAGGRDGGYIYIGTAR